MSQCYLDKQVLKILLIIQPVSLQRIAGLHHHWSYSVCLAYFSLCIGSLLLRKDIGGHSAFYQSYTHALCCQE